MDDSRDVAFTIEELWLLQSVVRHEGPQQRDWHFPPFSLALNDQIAEAIDFCDRYGSATRPLALTRGDLLLLDYVVPQSAKSAAGQPLGRQILLKSFRARQPSWGPEAAEPTTNRLEEWRHALADSSADHDADTNHESEPVA